MRPMKVEKAIELIEQHHVPIKAIAAVCPVPAMIVLDKTGGFYEPHETGKPAWVLPVCAADLDFPDAIEAPDPLLAVSMGPIVDLLAFSPHAPGHAAQLRRMLRLPLPQWPEIVVRSR